MFGASEYFYLIDKLDQEKAAKLKMALLSSDEVKDVRVRIQSGIVQIKAKRSMEEEVAMACSVAGCEFRTRISRKEAGYYP